MKKSYIFGILLILFGGIFSQSLWAQSLTLDMGTAANHTSRLVLFVFMLTILSLAPSLLVMVTSFTRLVIVFSFLRNAIGLQQSPPNVVMVSLALFLTSFIMAPSLQKAYEEGVAPYMDGKLREEVAFEKTMAPIKGFMLREVREKDLELFLNIARTPVLKSAADAPLKALIPAFMISELRRAFEIGFMIFLPFMIIDLLVASILMAMGMMMLPPMMISLPFKVIFFVLIDGWHVLVGSLIKSFHI